MRLAIFDLDNTLIAGDSDYAWGEYLCEQGIVDEERYRAANLYYYQQYESGKLDIYEFLAFSLAPLAQHPEEQLLQWREQFVTEKIRPMQLEKAVALVEKHRQAGDYLLIITATNHFVTEPIAKLFGVHDLIATMPEKENGAYTGQVAGTPSFQSGKVTRLNEWLANKDLSLEDSYFYSDSHNDIPLLSLVTHPVAVDPDEHLVAHANQNGWNILSLRD